MSQKKKFEFRLNLWFFKHKFEQRHSTVVSQLFSVTDSLKKLGEDPYLLKILGTVLRIGNCLNATNKNRKQADGFPIDCFSKPMSMKDSEGKSMMATVCQMLYEEDNEFINF